MKKVVVPICHVLAYFLIFFFQVTIKPQRKREKNARTYIRSRDAAM